MKKLEDFDKILKESDEVVEFLNFNDIIGVGPQICKILKVEDNQNQEYLKIAFDIADGDAKGMIKAAFDEDTRTDKKYPATGILIRSYKKAAERFFAAFITAVQKSNPGFKWDFDETKLVGKLFVANFGEEEYLSNDKDDNGKVVIKTSFKCVEPRSTQALRDNKIKVKEKKVIEESDTATHTPYYAAEHQTPTPSNGQPSAFEQSHQAPSINPDDDLPF